MSGVLYFKQKITDFIKTPFLVRANSSSAYVLYKALNSYNVQLLQDCCGGIYSEGQTKYMEVGTADSGSYGCLYYYTIWTDDDLENDVFLKVSKNAEVSLKNEALLQQAAHIILTYYGLPWAVPRVHTIVNHPRHGVSFTMDIIRDAFLFGDYLVKRINWRKECEENDLIVMEVISQLATYIMILEGELGLNHRDLKINNVLMVHDVPLENHRIQYGDLDYVLNSRVRTVLIDFGFACIGDVESNVLYASAGNYLMADMCPKNGRDMFLIFSNLWNVVALRRVLTLRARLLFKKWLMDDLGKDWALWLSAGLDKELLNIYKLVNESSFNSARAMPKNILLDIATNYPSVISAPNTL